jgi:hypothetical protein
MYQRAKTLLRRQPRKDPRRPSWWAETPAGPVVFDPSLRTAAELAAANPPDRRRASWPSAA